MYIFTHDTVNPILPDDTCSVTYYNVDYECINKPFQKSPCMKCNRKTQTN